MKMNLQEISDALRISRKAHLGQFRSDGKTPFFEHPRRVAYGLLKSGGNSDMICAALLHDSVEDGPKGITEEIEKSFNPLIIQAIKTMTKGKHEDYFRYIRRISQNPISTHVKIADIGDNLFGPDSSVPEKRKKKYLKALTILSK